MLVDAVGCSLNNAVQPVYTHCWSKVRQHHHFSCISSPDKTYARQQERLELPTTQLIQCIVKLLVTMALGLLVVLLVLLLLCADSLVMWQGSPQ